MKVFFKPQLFLTALALVGFLAGCTKNNPDPEPELQAPDLEGLSYLERIQTNSLLVKTLISEEVTETYPGYRETYLRYINNRGVPIAAYFAEADLSDPKIALEVGLPGDEAKMPAITTEITNMVAARDAAQPNKMVLGAVNGDFATGSTPNGYLVKDGTVLKTTFAGAYSDFIGVRKDGTAFIGDAEEFQAEKDNLQQALGGRPLLVAGEPLSTTDNSYNARTNIGFNGKKVVFLIVDGGTTNINSSHSAGLTLTECALLMKAVGVTDALYTNGGGPSALIARDELGEVVVRSKPSGTNNVQAKVASAWMITRQK
jgi:hypothetical protein